MKKLFLLAGVFALILSSCTQDLPLAPEEVDQEVTFTSVELKGLKAGFDCDNPTPDYATVVMTGPEGSVSKDVPVFFVDDVMYTQAIKLGPGDYTITQFLLYAEVEGENDLLVNAVPETNSENGALITNTLPMDFSVSPFTKAEIPLGILCFDENDYEAFGFSWFRVDGTVYRNKFFFGDFCTAYFSDYTNSLYGSNNVIGVDMPAIFKLVLSKDGDVLQTIHNEAILTGQKPLELVYLDADDDGDIYQIDLSIYVKVGDGFDYVHFGTFYFADGSDTMYTSLVDLNNEENGITNGTDGVYDFILGNCNVDGADIVFAPYMNLPGEGTQGITMVASIAQGEARTSYMVTTLSGIGAGYDVEDGDYDAFCFDLEHTISANGVTTYTDIAIYNSLYPASLPQFLQNENWGAVNWLVNNLGEFPESTWQDLQQALWTLEVDNNHVYNGSNHNGVVANLATVEAMVAAAILNGDGYQPMPGGYAAIVLEAGQNIQTVFTIVDP